MAVRLSTAWTGWQGFAQRRLPRALPGPRALGLFWAVFLGTVALGAATLQWLGPPRSAVVAPPPAHVDPPRPAAPQWDGKIASPDPALLEPSAQFPPAKLPRIAADGRTARQVYARPAPADGRPRIALIVSGIGLSDADSRAAIQKLPGPVTLAVSAYTLDAEPVLAAAREAGHEFLLSLPMEGEVSQDNAGPRALMTGATPAENRLNLEWALSRLQGYAGVTGAADNGMRGERFAAQTSSLQLALEEIARRGLLYVDPRPGKAAPERGRTVDVILDEELGRAHLEGRLAELERVAREKGSAIGLAGPPRPATLDRVAAWTRELEGRGFVLVPVSQLAAAP